VKIPVTGRRLAREPPMEACNAIGLRHGHGHLSTSAIVTLRTVMRGVVGPSLSAPRLGAHARRRLAGAGAFKRLTHADMARDLVFCG